jgi:Endoplasmic reticulum vesicle transporter
VFGGADIMKKGTWIGILLIVMIAVFSLFVLTYFSTTTETDKESIQKSMKETEERNAKIETLHQVIHSDLRVNRIEGDLHFSMGQRFTSETPSISVHVRDARYKKTYERKIHALVKKRVEEFDFGKVKTEVKVEERERVEMSEEEKRNTLLTDQIFASANNILREKGYESTLMSIGVKNPPQSLKIEVIEDKQRFKHIKPGVVRAIREGIKARVGIDIDINLTRKSETKVRDESWQPIFDAIMQETDKEFRVVTGFGYSFHPMPLEIIIKTSLEKGWIPWQTKRTAEAIEEYIKQVIEIKREELTVEEIPYKIIIRGKGGKKLN